MQSSLDAGNIKPGTSFKWSPQPAITCSRRFGGFIVNFEHISHLCSTVSIVNFEHVIADWKTS